MVKKQIEIYYQQRNLFPDQSTHLHLAQVWLSRQAAHGINIHENEIQHLSYTETLLCACLPHPQCAEALGLYILHKERIDIINDFPEFAMRFHQLMGPVTEIMEKGNLEQLYRKYNPNMPGEHYAVLFGKE